MMFNDHYGLTKAVLEGRKTMTRRIVSVPDTWHGIGVYAIGPDTDKRSLLLYDADEFLIEDRNTGLCGQVMPRYKVGEIVAVAQCYEEALSPLDWVNRLICKDEPGWKNKMYVRADLMPHRIRITNVSVERLQNISDEDCIREGIVKALGLYGCEGLCERGDQLYFNTPRTAFAALINKTSGKHTWNDNPYTFVYEFELIK